MPNGDKLNEQLEFEERIRAMSLDDRTVFIAKQVYALAAKVEHLSTRGITNKASAATSGVTAAIIVGIAEGFRFIFGR